MEYNHSSDYINLQAYYTTLSQITRRSSAISNKLLTWIFSRSWKRRSKRRLGSLSGWRSWRVRKHVPSYSFPQILSGKFLCIGSCSVFGTTRIMNQISLSHDSHLENLKSILHLPLNSSFQWIKALHLLWLLIVESSGSLPEGENQTLQKTVLLCTSPS